MKDQLNKYAHLKARYFRALHSSRQAKGHIRAYIGVTTWIHERRELEVGSDDHSAHISAFERALEDLLRVLQRGTFDESLTHAIHKWREEGEALPRQGGHPPLLCPPIPTARHWVPNGLVAISLFSGALGLDLGFLAAGFDLRFANDIDKRCQEVALRNLPSAPFLLADFSEVSCNDLLRLAGLSVGEADVLIGGPPCQPFSTAGKRGGLSDPRASPLKDFIRAINQLKPRAFVLEEVTGLKSARLRHIPIAQRRNRPLKPDQKKGSAFRVVMQMLHSTEYNITYGLLNASDFGAPQTRERLIIIGLREGEPSLPTPTHSNEALPHLFGETLAVRTSLWEATADLANTDDHFQPLSATREAYLRMVPPGGNWRHLPLQMIQKAMGGAYKAGGGKMGFFRRLAWDEPSPTVVTSPTQKGSMLCHPEATRPLTVEEYKRVQGFPDDWELPGGATTKYRLIGNAVPVHLSHAIANHLARLLGAS